MEEKQIFKVCDENGIESEAELLLAFEMDEKEYAIYSTDVENEDMTNIYSAELIKNEDGTNDLKNIDDPTVKEKITEIISSIINK